MSESTVTPSTTTGAPYMFFVAVGDQNLGDTLYVRWVSDYPPFAPNVSKILKDGPDGIGLPIAPSNPQAELRPNIPFEAHCEAFAPGIQQHRLVVVVSDRPFLKAATFGGDLRYSQVATRIVGQAPVPVTYPVMAGWNVVCPP